jgi:hypothetical protein
MTTEKGLMILAEAYLKVSHTLNVLLCCKLKTRINPFPVRTLSYLSRINLIKSRPIHHATLRQDFNILPSSFKTLLDGIGGLPDKLRCGQPNRLGMLSPLDHCRLYSMIWN